jgi:hypothetical protein
LAATVSVSFLPPGRLTSNVTVSAAGFDLGELMASSALV